MGATLTHDDCILRNTTDKAWLYSKEDHWMAVSEFVPFLKGEC